KAEDRNPSSGRDLPRAEWPNQLQSARPASAAASHDGPTADDLERVRSAIARLDSPQPACIRRLAAKIEVAQSERSLARFNAEIRWWWRTWYRLGRPESIPTSREPSSTSQPVAGEQRPPAGTIEELKAAVDSYERKH